LRAHLVAAWPKAVARDFVVDVETGSDSLDLESSVGKLIEFRFFRFNTKLRLLWEKASKIALE